MHGFRAECEDRLRAEFRIELNAAVAEGEQRWQSREEELQTQLSELQGQLADLQSQVNPSNLSSPSWCSGVHSRHLISYTSEEHPMVRCGS